ncbi:hypothetical protein F5888DRAFT_1806903 [Russula emetica]|nr:hypothetical protein F5888DRAFT_1806903 [Russula emetica]
MASGSNPRRSRQRVQDDDRVDPSTPQRGTPSSTRLVNIPKQAVEEASKSLRKIISPKGDDNEILNALKHVWIDVQEALEQDPKLKIHLATKDEFRKNVTRKGEKIFIDSLRAMAAKSDTQGSKAWEDLFEDKVFLKEPPAPFINPLHRASTSSEEAVERAWQRVFRGEAATVLLLTISSYLDKKRDPYSRQATIVNSSGTGKSRMVDQLATKIITVPVCLRPDPSTGYPRPDAALRSWLLAGEISDITLGTIRTRLHGFVYALLTVTRTTLESIDSDSENGKITETKDGVELRQAKLASAFRDRMTKGQSYQGPNAYREGFYKKVTRLADEFIKSRQQINDPKDTKQPKKFYPYDFEDGDEAEDAGKLLARFVDPHDLLDRDEGRPRRPLVIFAFDEAHILTDNPPVANRATWNMFSELRRILRQTSDQAIFSLFLSTAGRFNLFSPEISSDPSMRIQDSILSTVDPITEISFDDLAYDAPEYKIMLEHVVEMDWMCHLGRPLFASIYDAEEIKYRSKMELMDLAKAKLLDGPTTLRNNRSGSLACLSVRFALEFNMDGTACDVARTQVERHMRLCLAATAGRDTLVTLAGSEPLLAEAAYELMKGTEWNPVHHLAHHSDLNCVDRGRRGELVAALLIMQACDAARAGRRWVPVDVFMQELLPPAKYHILKESFPTFYCDGQKDKFAAIFKDYGIWFNHVIKVEEDKMFSADRLWKFITRGAMILCSNNQEGIDIVIPICHTQKALSRHSVTAILVQVKNAEKYQSKFDKSLFDGMNPIKLGLFPDKVDPKPVIRIVFALAAVNAGVDFPDAPQRDHHHYDKFTAFDVWCAGLENKTFKHIGADLGSYRLLLERSLRRHDAFELQDDREGHDEARRLRGSLRRRMAPLTTDNDAHHAIHFRGSESAA